MSSDQPSQPEPRGARIRRDIPPPSARPQPPVPVRPAARSLPVAAIAGTAVAALALGFGAGKITSKSGASLSAAAKTARQMFLYENTGKMEQFFDLLHPAQKGQIDRALYLRCNPGKPPAETLVANVADDYEQPFQFEGIPEKTAHVVTIAVRTTGEPVVRKIFTVKADGKWRWIMSATELAAYKRNTCVTQ